MLYAKTYTFSSTVAPIFLAWEYSDSQPGSGLYKSIDVHMSDHITSAGGAQESGLSHQPNHPWNSEGSNTGVDIKTWKIPESTWHVPSPTDSQGNSVLVRQASVNLPLYHEGYYRLEVSAGLWSSSTSQAFQIDFDTRAAWADFKYRGNSVGASSCSADGVDFQFTVAGHFVDALGSTNFDYSVCVCDSNQKSTHTGKIDEEIHQATSFLTVYDNHQEETKVSSTIAQDAGHGAKLCSSCNPLSEDAVCAPWSETLDANALCVNLDGCRAACSATSACTLFSFHHTGICLLSSSSSVTVDLPGWTTSTKDQGFVCASLSEYSQHAGDITFTRTAHVR